MKNTNTTCRLVMVIDDAEIDRYLADKILIRYAFAEKVIAVESAMDALEYLTGNQDNPEALPDLIFLDINMPEMSGFDFLDEYAELGQMIKKKCIIVMLSSSTLQEDRDLALSGPYVCNVMSKPLNPAKLHTIENSLCHHPLHLKLSNREILPKHFSSTVSVT